MGIAFPAMIFLSRICSLASQYHFIHPLRCSKASLDTAGELHIPCEDAKTVLTRHTANVPRFQCVQGTCEGESRLDHGRL